MKLKTICVVKHPVEPVWRNLRDRLPEIASRVEDIESVTIESKETKPDGSVHFVNVWKARPALPPVLCGLIRPEMLAWTDRSEWSGRMTQCEWRIEPHFFGERIDCHGVTRYEPAMGGRGARITFEGDFHLSAGGFLACRMPLPVLRRWRSSRFSPR